MVEFILFDTPADEVFLEGLGVTETLVMKYLADCVFGSTEEAALRGLLAAARVTDRAHRDQVRSIIRKFSEPRARTLTATA